MMLAHGHPHSFGVKERIELEEFLRRNMLRATVVLAGEPYRDADTWTMEWREGRIVGFSAHRLLRARHFDTVHIMATYCESQGLRRFVGPMLLQRPAFRELTGQRPTYWCLRTRNPLVERTLGRFDSVLTRELDIAPALLAARCFGSRARLDAGGLLRGSYPAGSLFLPPQDQPTIHGLDYRRDECLFLAGRVNIEAVRRAVERAGDVHAVGG